MKKFLFLFFLLIAAAVWSGCSKIETVDSTELSAPTAKPAAPAPAPEPERFVEVQAGVGVTHKADWEDSSEKPMSIVTVPLATYFHAQEMSVFNMQIPSAMNLYKAETGEFPKTEDEFMTNIVKKNQIILPELPEGDVYFYDPATATLMVRARQAPKRPH